MLIIMGIVLVLTKSRAGILAGIFLPVVWWSYSFIKKRWILILTYGLGTILLPIMYMIKKDSADGRLLIFRCAWDMITERPLLGYGVNGIQAHYMDYQAKWLAKHTESSFSYLADNVKHVFNEYLSIGICFGIVGWLILALFAWLIIYCYRRRPSLEGKFALMTIATIGILGCFSYPLSYPFTWIALTLNSYILIHQNTLLNLSPNKHTRYFIAAVLFIVSSLSCYKIISRTYAELEWKRISDIASRGRGNEVFFRYNALMPILGNEPYFLYNYAAELYIAGHYHHALRITQHCQKYWSDYDLEILHGELLNKLNKKEEAEQHFKHASHMCPARFIPLYKLYQLYKETGNEAKARQIGIIILNKPVKIESEIIQRIKEKIKLSLSYKNI